MRTFHKQACLLLVLALSMTPAIAQEGGNGANKSRVDSVFAQYDKPGSPGCALGVIKDGKLIYARGYGMANLEHNIPNGPNLVYDIGSTSKQFAAASILLLAQQGKLSIDDEVRKYIPELPAYQRPITIRHLLNHTSGLRDYLTLFSLAGTNFDDTTTEKDALDIIVRQKGLNFEPGDEFLYSNSGYFLLSVIIKKTSGKSFAEFAGENIFEPLGMKHTVIFDNHKKIIPMRATGYSPARGGFQIEMSNFEQTGDGAVQTSVEDLLLWDRNFYDPKVGGKALLDQLHVLGILNNGEKLQYAAGLFIDEHKGLRRVSHGGSWAGYRAELARFPDQKLSVACLCNSANSNPSRVATMVAEVYLEAELKAVAKSPDQPKANTESTAEINISEEKLRERVGVYRSRINGDLRRITFRDGKLRVDPFGFQSFELKPIGETRFSLLGQEGVFVEFRISGGKPEIHVTLNNRKLEEFEKMEAFEPAADKLADFAANYFSEELNTTYRVILENGKLFLIGANGIRGQMTPTVRDSFAVIGGPKLDFSRDGGGKISGFAIHAGRIRNVRFSK